MKKNLFLCTVFALACFQLHAALADQTKPDDLLEDYQKNPDSFKSPMPLLPNVDNVILKGEERQKRLNEDTRSVIVPAIEPKIKIHFLPN